MHYYITLQSYIINISFWVLRTLIKSQIPLVLSTKYNPCIRKIKQCLVKYWQLLKHNEICRDLFTKEPIIAYKKHRNLGDILTLKINRYTILEKADS